MALGARMNLWVVVPAYNEASVVGDVVTAVKHVWPSVVTVDDGSSDETAEAARLAGSRVVRHAVNLGQGAAIQTGIDYAIAQGASHICTFDADGQHAVEDIAALLSRLTEESADIALGSRTLGNSVGIPAARSVMLRGATLFTRWHTGLSVTDAHNGLRLFTLKAARTIRITQPGMAHASEILYQISKSNLKWVEVPVTITYTRYSLKKGQSAFNFVKILLDLASAAWSK
jgi:polyprenyl-phospho-N-acetylgalactosaminyl synthase